MAAELAIPTDEAVVQVRLTRGPIVTPARFMESNRQAATAGAVITFQGWVRGREPITAITEPSVTSPDAHAETEEITGLDYQIYEPMTSQELTRLAKEYAQRFGVIAVDIEHSFDFVANGECSFVLQVAAAHRREAIDFTDEFINAMKRHVPIWKVPRWNQA